MGGHVTFEAPELPEETLMEVRNRFYTQLWEMAKKGVTPFILCILCMYGAVTAFKNRTEQSVIEVSLAQVIVA